MIACVGPGYSSANHTINTLRYSDRLKEKTSFMMNQQKNHNNNAINNNYNNNANNNNPIINKNLKQNSNINKEIKEIYDVFVALKKD